MADLIHKDLSYKLVGLAFQVDNLIGYGFKEKVYSDAFEELLLKNDLHFKRELYCPVIVNNRVIAKRYLDFLVDDKIIVEIKVGSYRFKDVCNQLFEYLKLNNLELGIIIRFSKTGIHFKRILNISNKNDIEIQ